MSLAACEHTDRYLYHRHSRSRPARFTGAPFTHTRALIDRVRVSVHGAAGLVWQAGLETVYESGSMRP